MGAKSSLGRIVACCVCILCIAGCNKEPADYSRSEIEGERISIIALIATPEKYDDIRATVRGYLHVEEDGAALYVAEEDAEYEAHLSAIWIGDFDEIYTFTKEEIEQLGGKYVGITGTIDAQSYGPTKDYNCEIKRIENIKELEVVNELPKEE